MTHSLPTRFGMGQPVLRTEDPRLLRGKGRYSDDFNLPHQAYAVFVRSPHAHADIASIDKSAAEAMPGVVAVLTGTDYATDGLGSISGATPWKRRDGKTMLRPPRPALTKDRVRYVGQPLAMVIADSLSAAKDAAEAVAVGYNLLPANVDTEKASKGAPAIWPDAPDNESFYVARGDDKAVEAVLAAAAHVVRNRFVISRASANTIEPRSALGHYDEGNDRYTIYTGVQRPYAWRSTLTSGLFHIDENQLTVVTGDMGGSFGMKGAIYNEAPLVGWASKRVGRPVKWTADRSEALLADDHGRDNVTDAELALDKDGKFLGLRVTTTANLGAYVSFMGMGPSTGNVGGLAGVYTIPAISNRVSAVFTNTVTLSPYRGAGRPEASYVIERMIDLAARELKIAPWELRRRNMIPPSAMPYKTALIFTYDCGEFEALMDEAMKRADVKGFGTRRDQSQKAGRLRGLGMSCTIEQAAAPQTETAELRFDPGGTLTILVGTTPHGQGHETIYKQLVCEKFDIAPEKVRVIEGDTDKVSFGTGTGGSRSATLGTMAVSAGVDKVLAKTKKIAAHMLEAAEADIASEPGKFTVAGTDKSVKFLDVVKSAFDPSKLPKGLEPGLYETATYDPKAPNYPNGCQIVEVEIEPDTGFVEVVKYTVVDDVGFEINPMCVHGQIHGGVAQGLGQALMEQIVYDDQGQLVTGTFMDYAMPKARHLPPIDTGSRPTFTHTNPLGIKGAGEGGTVGALPAVMNAVNDALAPLGVRHLEMPCTPERVWRAIQDAQKH